MAISLDPCHYGYNGPAASNAKLAPCQTPIQAMRVGWLDGTEAEPLARGNWALEPPPRRIDGTALVSKWQRKGAGLGRYVLAPGETWLTGSWLMHAQALWPW
jgi:hypothetical protein